MTRFAPISEVGASRSFPDVWHSLVGMGEAGDVDEVVDRLRNTPGAVNQFVGVDGDTRERVSGRLTDGSVFLVFSKRKRHSRMPRMTTGGLRVSIRDGRPHVGAVLFRNIESIREESRVAMLLDRMPFEAICLGFGEFTIEPSWCERLAKEAERRSLLLSNDGVVSGFRHSLSVDGFSWISKYRFGVDVETPESMNLRGGLSADDHRVAFVFAPVEQTDGDATLAAVACRMVVTLGLYGAETVTSEPQELFDRDFIDGVLFSTRQAGPPRTLHLPTSLDVVRTDSSLRLRRSSEEMNEKVELARADVHIEGDTLLVDNLVTQFPLRDGELARFLLGCARYAERRNVTYAQVSLDPVADETGLWERFLPERIKRVVASYGATQSGGAVRFDARSVLAHDLRQRERSAPDPGGEMFGLKR